MEGASKPVENNEPFTRTVSLTLKARLKNMKKQILEELCMGDMCNLRVYYFEPFDAPSEDEPKSNGEAAPKKDNGAEINRGD